MPNGSWIDELLELLCKIYRAWGGDCSDFDKDPHKAVSIVVDTYATEGPPVMPGPLERAEFLALLDQLEAHLALPGNSLSPADNEALANLIADLRKDLA